MKRRPNLFIAGAPKSGTTSLARYLADRPDVFFSRHKEPHYFAKDMPNRRMMTDEESYLELFGEAKKEHKILAEASTLYLYSDTSIKEIRAFNPEARIIAMLREPVGLAISLHAQLLYSLDEDVSDFEKAWNLQQARSRGDLLPKRCLDPSVLQYGKVAMLGQQVQRLFTLFPREQVHIIFFEDFVKNISNEYKKVVRFLELPPDERTTFPRYNERKGNRSYLVARLTQKTPKALIASSKVFKKIFGIKELNIFPRLRNLNQSPANTQEPPPGLTRHLQQYFHQDILLLERLTGRDLSHWRVQGEQ